MLTGSLNMAGNYAYTYLPEHRIFSRYKAGSFASAVMRLNMKFFPQRENAIASRVGLLIAQATFGKTYLGNCFLSSRGRRLSAFL